MPLNTNIGGQNTPDNKYKYKESKSLMEEQARYLYKKVESCNIININTPKQEIVQYWELNRLDDKSGEVIPYRELIVNNTEQVETVFLQMEQWLMLSNVVNYIQYHKHPRNFRNLSISAVNN